MNGAGDQDYPPDTRLAQHLGAEPRILPGRAAATLFPAHRHAVIVQQLLRHDPRLGRRRAVVQAAGGQYRQAAGLGQAGRVANTLAGHQAGLVFVPGAVAAYPPGAQHHNGVGTLRQPWPLRLPQRLLRLQLARPPVHGHRQAHHQQAQEAGKETEHGEARKAAAQHEAQEQQQKQQSRWHEELFEDEADRHWRLLVEAPSLTDRWGISALSRCGTTASRRTYKATHPAAAPGDRRATQRALQLLRARHQARTARRCSVAHRARRASRGMLQQRQLFRCGMPTAQPIHILIQIGPDQLHLGTAQAAQLQLHRAFVT